MNSRAGTPCHAPCHLQSSDFGDIARPNEPPDQSAPNRLRVRSAAHGARDPDATAEERRFGRGIWRRRDGKHFWRTNHQRFSEVHGVAGGHFFCAHLRLIDPLRP